MNIYKTPQSAKFLFKGFLFPCDSNKNPILKKGESWSFWRKSKDSQGGWIRNNKEIIRSIDSDLCGLDCGQAGLIVADFDLYKQVFKQSRVANEFLNLCEQKSRFAVHTAGGGLHIFFKQPRNRIIGCPKPYAGVEIKGRAGYVCLYNLPFNPNEVICRSFNDFYNKLPEWPFLDFSNRITAKVYKSPYLQRKRACHRPINRDFIERYCFGPGLNNAHIPYRAGKAGARGDIRQRVYDLQDLVAKNPNNPEVHKHIMDYEMKFNDSYNRFFKGGRSVR